MKQIIAWTLRHLSGITSVATLVAAFLFAAATAHAQITTGIPPITNPSAFHGIICNIFNVMFWVLISVSIIMIMWAAYLYVFSEGGSDRPSEAKMTILYALFGLVAAFLAKGAPLLIASLFGVSSSVHGC